MSKLLLQLTFDTKIGRFFRTREILSDKRDYAELARELMENIESKINRATMINIFMSVMLLLGALTCLGFSLLISRLFLLLALLFGSFMGYRLMHLENNEEILMKTCENWCSKMKGFGIKYHLEKTDDSKIVLVFFQESIYRRNDSLCTIIDEQEYGVCIQVANDAQPVNPIGIRNQSYNNAIID